MDTTSDVLQRLAGLRLGAHERRILLQAVPPYAHKAPYIPPPAPGRSAEEAHRRAIRRLTAAGLVYHGHMFERRFVYTERSFGWRPLHSVRLTVLGVAVVAVVRPQLESGTPLRWAAHAPAIAAAFAQADAEMDASLKRSDERLAALFAQLGALGRV